MFIKSGIKEKINSVINAAFLCKVIAHAEEEPKGDVTPPAKKDTKPSGVFTIDDIENARREEKDKLYPQLERARIDLESQIHTNNDLIVRNSVLTKEIETLKSRSVEDDPRFKEISGQLETLKQENSRLQESFVSEEEIRKKVEEEYEVKLYAHKVQSEHKGDVLSIFIDSITGSTKEEVDAALDSAIKKTAQVKKDLGVSDRKPEDPQDSHPSVRPPVSNPNDFGRGNQQVDAEYIRNLDPRSEEYKEFRKKLGLK